MKKESGMFGFRLLLSAGAVLTVVALAVACASAPASSTPTGAALPAPAAEKGIILEAIAPSGMPTSVPGSTGYESAAQSPSAGEFSTEEYQRITDNPFLSALDNPVSTFSIDVDTASYANVRRYLTQMRQLPPKDAVRIEELVNYFTYDYPEPQGEHPVGVTFAMSEAPWAPSHHILRVAIKARAIKTEDIPASNLVFLIDTSGSMDTTEKLPLVKDSLSLLVQQLRPQDRVSIVAYAGSAGLVLDSTPGSKKERILEAIEKLEAGGSTAGGAGLLLAYEVAKKNFINGGNNRIILCTDGDFNVGVSSTSELERLVEEKRKEQIFLTVAGFGMGNYKDARMEIIADKGNGTFAYIDTLLEGKKVFMKEIWGSLYTVAKDVKIQIEFNPAKVSQYRLIGYENRLLAREDFNDDTKDAGEMGAGQTVTAFYEIVPAGVESASQSVSQPKPASEPLEFQKQVLVPSDDMLVFRLRYKIPGDGAETSRLMTSRLKGQDILLPLSAQGDDFRFATAVIEFGMLLRESRWRGSASWQSTIARARDAKGKDYDGYRAEFVRLAELAEMLSR